MQWLRRTEQSFYESDIQEEYAGPNRLLEIRANEYERLSDCQRSFRTNLDLDVPALSINPTGYQHYQKTQRAEEAMWAQMISMKKSQDRLTVSPRTDAMLAPLVAAGVVEREQAVARERANEREQAAAREREAQIANSRSRSRSTQY